MGNSASDNPSLLICVWGRDVSLYHVSTGGNEGGTTGTSNRSRSHRGVNAYDRLPRRGGPSMKTAVIPHMSGGVTGGFFILLCCDKATSQTVSVTLSVCLTVVHHGPGFGRVVALYVQCLVIRG
jgi:hypothetical protein